VCDQATLAGEDLWLCREYCKDSCLAAASGWAVCPRRETSGSRLAARPPHLGCGDRGFESHLSDSGVFLFSWG
jgi:hypothetical protein